MTTYRTTKEMPGIPAGFEFEWDYKSVGASRVILYGDKGLCNYLLALLEHCVVTKSDFVEKVKWQLRVGERYWEPIFDDCSGKYESKEFLTRCEFNYYGNFRTEEICQKVCDKMNQALREGQEEN